MRVLIYDNVQSNQYLSFGWKLGSMFFKFDKVIKATSITQMFEELQKIPGTIDEIQYWGHGLPGMVVLNDKVLDQNHPGWAELNPKMGLTSLLWFRTCSSFSGVKGKAFATALKNKLACKVAGHTYDIGFPFHSGLQSLKPGQTASWSDNEGKGLDGKQLSSSLFAPNTIYTWQDKLPVGY